MSREVELGSLSWMHALIVLLRSCSSTVAFWTLSLRLFRIAVEKGRVASTVAFLYTSCFNSCSLETVFVTVPHSCGDSLCVLCEVAEYIICFSSCFFVHKLLQQFLFGHCLCDCSAQLLKREVAQYTGCFNSCFLHTVFVTVPHSL